MRLRVAAVLLGILAVTSAPAFAQATGGGKVGVNWGTVSDEEEDGVGWKPGFVVGGFVDIPLSGMFSFAPEVLYTQKGAKNDFTDVGFEIKQKLKIDFVQIPLLFKVGPTDSPYRPFVSFGPAIGFVAKARFTESIDDVEETDVDIKDELKSTEFSLMVGAGVHFGRGLIEGRYDHGFTNLDEIEGGEIKTRTFSVLVGFGF